MSAPQGPGPLGEALQAWRARLKPSDVGVLTYGERRRVSGLRREELAMLAGVSPSYYARLEQGQSRNASPEVLGAIASALQLTDTERRHLTDLVEAGRRRPTPKRAPLERVDPCLSELLVALGDVPAVVLGRRSDVLAWTATGHALLADGTDRSSVDSSTSRPNMAELVFLDPHMRDLYTNWTSKARAVVGNLRLVVGQHPDDAALASLIGGLSIASKEFAHMWADHRVQPCATARYEMRHPLVGTLTVTQQSLRAPANPDQILLTCTAPQNSPSAEALTLLAQLIAETSATEGRYEIKAADQTL